MESAIVAAVIALLVAVLTWLVIRGLGLDTGWRWRLVRTDFDRAAVAVAEQVAATTKRISDTRLTMRRRYVHLSAPEELVRSLGSPAGRERFRRRVLQIATQLATTRHLSPLGRIRGLALVPTFDFQLATWRSGPLQVLLTDTGVDPFMVPALGKGPADLIETSAVEAPAAPAERPAVVEPADDVETHALDDPFADEQPADVAATSPPRPSTGEVVVKRTVGGERRIVSARSPEHFDAQGWAHRSATGTAVTIEFVADPGAALRARVTAHVDGVRTGDRKLSPGDSRVLDLPATVSLRSARLGLSAG